MSRILLRCDASLSIGSGHVIRCRTLARELVRRGSEVVFACRQQTGALIDLLEQEFLVLRLAQHHNSVTTAMHEGGLKGRDLYKAWLGCSQKKDARETLEGLQKHGINDLDVVVVDHYGIGALWEKQVIAGLTSCGTSRPRLLAIDDLADRAHQADWLLDQNFFGEVAEGRYADLLPQGCQTFLGPDYALLGPEYSQMRSYLPRRTELKRILIFYGSIDSLGLTLRALSTLSSPEFGDIAIDVVLPIANSNADRIARIAKQRPATNLYAGLPSLAGLIARADLAIGASGATTWERICLGCPCITSVIAENQLQLAEFLEQKGLIYTVNKLASGYESSLATGIRYFSEPGVLASISERLIPLCPGTGAATIAEAILA